MTQDAYVAAYRHRERFRGEAPGVAWLHRIVVNAALSALRRHHAVVREIDVGDRARVDVARATADRIAVADALAELTPRQRAAVILRYYHDYDYTTIARILDTTSTNVGAMLSRALDRLRIELELELEPAPAAVEMVR